MSQVINIDQNTIRQILAETHQQLRDCQLKDYSVHAHVQTPGYVFVNMYEHPDSYAAMMQVLGCPLAPRESVPQNLAEYLTKNGYSEVKEKSVLICDTQGALDQVSEAAFLQMFVLDSTIPRNMLKEYLAADWRLVMHKGEKAPSAKGFIVPEKYSGVVKSPRGIMLSFNHPVLQGHGLGDVIILQSNGIMYPMNNALFGNTYNLNVGGWSQLITRTAKTLPLTTDRLKKLLRLA